MITYNLLVFRVNKAAKWHELRVMRQGQNQLGKDRVVPLL
jgi:hypothetical protein